MRNYNNVGASEARFESTKVAAFWLLMFEIYKILVKAMEISNNIVQLLFHAIWFSTCHSCRVSFFLFSRLEEILGLSPEIVAHPTLKIVMVLAYQQSFLAVGAVLACHCQEV